MRLTECKNNNVDGSVFVSVIVPVYRQLDELALCLQALRDQTLGAEHFEVLVVDNEKTSLLAASIVIPDNCRIVHEPKPGSYAARNAGIENATGSVLAFTDADCIPNRSWLENGLDAMRNNPSALIVGRIDLFPKSEHKPTAAELWDIRQGFPQRLYAETKGFGATANVMTERSTLEHAGNFDASLKSGGDYEWGRRVSSQGHPAVYADDVLVRHPARASFKEIVQKISRVVRGARQLERQQVYEQGRFVAELRRQLVPPIGYWFRVMQDRGLCFSHRIKLCVMFTGIRYYTVYVRVRVLAEEKFGRIAEFR